jgi:riboflavin synthase
MFTGLIQAMGQLTHTLPNPEGGAQWGITLTANTPETTPLLAAPIGASIALDGCCLTRVPTPVNAPNNDANTLWFDLSAETLEKTVFASLAPGHWLNMEGALCMGQPLGGHLVTGHIDATATLAQCTPYGNSHILRFKLQQPQAMALIVEKGSVALNGISLTINTVIQDVFSVAIIPHTWAHTTLQHVTVGQTVNIETDMIGRTVHHLMAVGRVPTLYDKQAEADKVGGSSVPTVGGNIKLGEWFNGAPC